ncbi:hypothetical protein V1523DRAFT_441596 [Lipomyces doorenjongii]
MSITGEDIYFTGRDSKRAAAVISECEAKVPNIKLNFIAHDVASLATVATAKQLISISQRLDILMCNAGVMALPPGLTEDGYEVQFGANHMGHDLCGVVFKDLRTTQDYGLAGQWLRYGQCKLANILYACELARRYPNITTVSVHPSLWAATQDKGKIVNGAYYESFAILGKHDKKSKSEKLAEELWEWTQKKLEGYQA